MLQVFLQLPSQITWPILLRRLQYNRKGQNVQGSLSNIASKFDSDSPHQTSIIILHMVYWSIGHRLLAHMSDNRLVQETCNWGVGTLTVIFRGKNRFFKELQQRTLLFGIFDLFEEYLYAFGKYPKKLLQNNNKTLSTETRTLLANAKTGG